MKHVSHCLCVKIFLQRHFEGKRAVFYVDRYDFSTLFISVLESLRKNTHHYCDVLEKSQVRVCSVLGVRGGCGKCHSVIYTFSLTLKKA